MKNLQSEAEMQRQLAGMKTTGQEARRRHTEEMSKIQGEIDNTGISHPSARRI